MKVSTQQESSDSEDEEIYNTRKDLFNGLISPTKTSTRNNDGDKSQLEPLQEEAKVIIICHELVSGVSKLDKDDNQYNRVDGMLQGLERC